MTTSLFAHLLGRFPTPPEVLTTEAFAFVLERSPAAAAAVVAYARAAGAALPGGAYTFRSEDAELDGGRPDLVARDAASFPLLMIEAKFWAGLTESQPERYLARLASTVAAATAVHGPGAQAMLLFVAPAKRGTLLWSELLRRADLDGSTTTVTGPLRQIAVSDNLVLALTTWTDLLAAVRAAPGVASDPAVDADLRQIEGLVERQDSQAFLPLTTTELSDAMVPRRWRDFDQLVDAATDVLTTAGVVTRQGLSTGKDRNGWGKYIRMHGTDVLFTKHARLWQLVAPTPLWLRFWGTRNAAPAKRARVALADLGHTTPQRLFAWQDHAVVPLYLPHGVEQAVVVDSIVDQIRAVADKIALVPLSALGPAVPAVASEEPDEDEV